MGRGRAGLTWDGNPTVKPPFGTAEVNWGHPLANGLVGLWLFNERAGTRIQNLAHASAGLGTMNNTAGWVMGRAGQGLSPVLQTYWVDCGNALNYTNPISAVVIAESAFTTTAVKHLISKGFDSGASTTQWYLVQEWTGTIWRLKFGAFVSGVTREAVGVTSLSDNVVRTLGGSYDGTAYRVYINGVQDASSTDTAPGGTTRKIYIGAVDDGTDPPLQGWEGKIYLAAHWKIALLQDKMLWFHAEPYAVLQPVIQRRYFVLVAAGGTWPGWVSSRGGWAA